MLLYRRPPRPQIARNMTPSSVDTDSTSSSSIPEGVNQVIKFTPLPSETVENETVQSENKPRIRASILEYKTVNQMYDSKYSLASISAALTLHVL